MLRRIGHVFVFFAIATFCLTVYSAITKGSEMGAGIVFTIIFLIIAYILGAFKNNARRIS